MGADGRRIRSNLDNCSGQRRSRVTPLQREIDKNRRLVTRVGRHVEA
jgi:hypothetical protein